MAMLLIYCHAQDLPKITPPSPEASALAKFTEVPVSHYTGVPNISIPIHTIQQNGISIPISLNYHSRGIKVEEIAPRYGLGWALQYGGSISRQTRGGVDESQYGYLNNNYDMDFFTDANKRADVENTYTFNQEYDFTPDLFHFNANGTGGKFIIDKVDGKALVQGFDDIDITYNNLGVGNHNGIQSFVITDKHGNKFYYGVSKDGNRTARNYDDLIMGSRIPMNGSIDPFTPSADDYYNSWQLLEIETSYGDMIEFRYYQQPEASYTYRHLYDKVENSIPVHYAMQLRMYQFQLSEVRFNKGKLMFQRGTEREDLHGSHVLDEVTLYDKQNNPIKSYKLDYVYSNSLADNNVHDFLEASEPRANKRLFLSSIQETAPNQEQLPPYLFEYSAQLLPNRFSTSQDLWGYFNGKNNGQYLTFFNYGSRNVNRTVDVTRSEAGLLKKITYPTKGSTTFEYEQNLAITPPELQNLFYQDVNPTVSKGAQLSHLQFPIDSIYDGYKYSIKVNIGANIVGTVKSTVIFYGPTYNVEMGTYGFQEGESDNIIAPGEYDLIVNPPPGHHPINNPDQGFVVFLNWEEAQTGEVNPTGDILLAGGKRIKKINYNDANGTIRTKEYEYLDSAGETTSGRIFGLPNFYSINNVIGRLTILDAFGAVPGSPLGTPQGNSVGYARVTEYDGEKNNNNGKTVYEFSVVRDAGTYYEFPYPLPTDNEWLRGRLFKSEVFRKNAGIGYSLVEKTENTYLYGDILFNYLLPPPVFNPGGYSTNCNSNSNPMYSKNRRRYHLPLIQFIEPNGTCGGGGNLAYNTYYLTGGTLDLGRSVSTSYFDNGRELTTTTDYFYDYDDHYQLSSTQTRDSEGLARMTKMYYGTDVNNTELINRHRYSEVVRQETFLDKNDDGLFQSSELIGKQETDYRLWTNANNQYLPEYVKTQKGSGPLENRIVYHAYDDYGNPLQVSRPNGQDISYIWGYNNQYPVAKVENANRTQIDALSGFGTDFDTGAGGLTSTQENRLRSDLPKAIVTTYSYAPLIGLKTVTNPNMDTIKYFYDAFNRLEKVKDRNDKMLSEHKYQYKDQ